MVFIIGTMRWPAWPPRYANAPFMEKSIATRAPPKLDKDSTSQDNSYIGDQTA
jgi:hypothetical protein